MPYLHTIYLFLGIILLTEYGLKQFWENFLETGNIKLAKVYIFYRITHFILLIVVLTSFFVSARAWIVLTTAAGLAVCTGTLEFIPCWLSRSIYRRFGVKNRLVYLFPFLLLVILCLYFPAVFSIRPRRFVLDFFFLLQQNGLGAGNTGFISGLIFIFSLLGQPANYIIRCVNAKEEDQLLPEPLCGYIPACLNLTRAGTEAAVASDMASLNEETLKAGRVIGILERWLIVIFILLKQYGMIGFVLTAKSIARFKKFEEPRFAEYYLMGTLYSTLLALLAGIFLLYMQAR
ncbi:MAG: hypothetical protein ACM3WV_02090 [Bacillota bacterium]